ncbi:MAG: hypothetical protein NTX35_05425, partial [Verrucomicrobia bacterium]|nr:hypothetical protein [Verrucomicrobiota bacterium]
AAASLPELFDSWTSTWVAGVILFESTSFPSPHSFYPQGVKTYEATGFAAGQVIFACRHASSLFKSAPAQHF